MTALPPGLGFAARRSAALALLLALAACTSLSSPRTSLTPPSRPAGLGPAAAPAAPSPRSSDLARYYQAVQTDLLTQGLLRTDGGGPDTPFSADDLARNFEAIAFYDEYTRTGGAPLRSSGRAGQLSRWSGPVRYQTEFGPSVPEQIREREAVRISNYVTRLARVTGHPISNVQRGGNFTVFVASEDDRDFLQERLVELIPNITEPELDLFRDLPRSFYCLVVAVSGGRDPHNYIRAVALIRSEHPDLVRLSCIHEELAQGLGLPNDSPAARPSIFNDDDEFALLTDHDEMLLKMLYDPRLEQGMTAEEARPVTRIIAREQMGQSL